MPAREATAGSACFTSVDEADAAGSGVTGTASGRVADFSPLALATAGRGVAGVASGTAAPVSEAELATASTGGAAAGTGDVAAVSPTVPAVSATAGTAGSRAGRGTDPPREGSKVKGST